MRHKIDLKKKTRQKHLYWNFSLTNNPNNSSKMEQQALFPLLYKICSCRLVNCSESSGNSVVAEENLYVCQLASGEFSAMVTESLRSAGLKRGRINKVAGLTWTASCFFSSSPFCSYYWSNEMKGKHSCPHSFASVSSALLLGSSICFLDLPLRAVPIRA